MDIGVAAFTSETADDPGQLAKRAEELGFTSFWVPEHPVVPIHYTTPYVGSADGVIPQQYRRILDPFIALARASAVTKRIKLGTAICLVPERNPLLLAKEVATLDRLCGGRFAFGVGAGWLKEQVEIMGAGFAQRWRQTTDAVKAMKALWTQDVSQYQGEFYRFPELSCFPKPMQKPHPPILVGGFSMRVLKQVAEWGDGWMPILLPIEKIKEGRKLLHDLAKRGGRDAKSITISMCALPGQFRSRKEMEEASDGEIDEVIAWIGMEEGGARIGELETVARAVLQ